MISPMIAAQTMSELPNQGSSRRDALSSTPRVVKPAVKTSRYK